MGPGISEGGTAGICLGLALLRKLSYFRRMAEKRTTNSMRMTALLLPVVCCLVSAALAMWAAAPVQFFWLAVLLSVIIGMLVLRTGQRNESSTGLLETPFYLSHDPEVFERYQRISQQLLRISQRFNKATTCTELGDGQVVFVDTETWRLAYEMLLRAPTVFHYRSIAVVRHPKYWQDAAGTGSMQFNFQLIDDHIVTIERIVLIADQLWPKDQDLPVEELRQWIHEQSVHGIWIRLARISDLQKEPELVKDIGIYGQLAVGTQSLAEDNLRTQRFVLDFNLTAIRDAEQQWEKLGVYCTAYKDLLDQFRL